MDIGLGIDTGGTYTDCVLLNRETNEVIGRAKALTTRDDLVVGISESISRLDSRFFKDISLVSLSSTLATNTVVEGKGCRVGSIAIGMPYVNTVNADMEFTVKGTHDLNGNEDEPLDVEAVREALNAMKGLVDSVAITGYLAIRNPEHEETVARMTREILGVPAVQGHELSSGLGFNERMITAIMNARLLPIIIDLIRSVYISLKNFKIDASLMIVKGDGTIMSSEMASNKPIETVLSGPASSLTGARALTGCEDAIMIDVGGTTTDIGILRGGIPRLENEGALIEGHRTRVLAASISTYGIGGDSRIIVNGCETILTPVRVIPLCIAASKWPRVGERLRFLSGTKPTRFAESSKVEDMHQETEFFIASRPRTTERLSDCDIAMLDIIRDEPFTLSEIGGKLGLHPFSFDAARMEKLGLVTRIGVTPTDLLHAEGSYAEYDREASKLGVDYLSRKAGVPMGDFIADAKAMIEIKIATCLMKDLLLEETGSTEYNDVTAKLVLQAITHRQGKDFGIGVKLNKPIIGIGAPVGAWLPKVAEMFGTELLLPENSDVGNAIGAITGSVLQSSTALIKPKGGDIDEDPGCTVFLTTGRFEFDKFSEGLRFAENEAKELAGRAAREAGATGILFETKRRDRSYTAATDGSRVTLETEITVTASGKPDLAAGKRRSA